eukprot:scaffold49135_cov76-Phaeocystis_antarctica.AAC.4
MVQYLPSESGEATAGGSIGLKGGSRPCQRRIHSFLRRGAGGDAIQVEALKRRQRAAVERGGKSGASRVGHLGVVEVEVLELLQPSSRQRQRTGRRRQHHEGGEALVAERVVAETESRQRGHPPQGRREGHQVCVADGGVPQREVLEPRQGASAQGGGERHGACVAHRHIAQVQHGHGRQRARAQPLRQPLHAAGAG